MNSASEAIPGNVATNPIRVLVADYSRLGTQLLVDALQRDERFEPLAAEFKGFESQASALKPDVAIVGAESNGGNSQVLEVLRMARAAFPKMYLILLVESSMGDLIVEAFRAGVRGVLCRDDSLEILVDCVNSVNKGQVWARNDQLLYVLETLSQHSVPMSVVDATGTALLSKRELDVVQSVAEGMTNREIAARLQLSEHTIKNYLFRVFDKLGVSNRAELVSFALNHRSHAPERAYK
jgi:two-component system, NarL family, nitrate/nitrite response regulator NarL